MDNNNNCRDCARIDEITSILRNVAPEIIEILEDRYNILNVISYMQPIGRRSLSNKLNIFF